VCRFATRVEILRGVQAIRIRERGMARTAEWKARPKGRALPGLPDDRWNPTVSQSPSKPATS